MECFGSNYVGQLGTLCRIFFMLLHIFVPLSGLHIHKLVILRLRRLVNITKCR